MPKFTRKAEKGHSFPMIRRKLDHVRASAMKKPTPKEFSRLWKKMFGKPLSEKMSKEYLDILHKVPNAYDTNTEKEVKGQKGGAYAPLGAPVGYDMRFPQMATTSVPYLTGGFGFANINSLTEGSPKEYLGTSAVPPDTTNKVGGGKRKTRKQAGGSQPFGASIPATIPQAFAMTLVGRGLPDTGAPEVNTRIHTR